MKRFLVLLLVLSFFVGACAKSPIYNGVDEGKGGMNGYTDEDGEDSGQDNEEDEEVFPRDSESTQITFHDPEILDAGPIIDQLDIPDDYHENFYLPTKEDYVESLKAVTKFWKSGVFESGKYEGQDLVIVQPMCDGPCTIPVYRFAVDTGSNEWTLLAPYSDESTSSDFVEDLLKPSKTDNGIVIEAFEAPETMGDYANGYTLLLDDLAGVVDDIPSSDISFEDASFSAYIYETTNCIYAVYPDGVQARYTLLPSMFKNPDPAQSQKLSFTNNDGETIEQEYVLSSGGCGFAMSCLARLTPTAAEEALLTKIGTLEGEEVFMFSEIGEEPDYSDENQTLLRALYNIYNSYSYKSSLNGETVMTIEEFGTSGHVFFYKLDEKNYTLIFGDEFAVGAECGKPVIYLYPEERGIFNVKVGIDEMTVSIPHYGENGWTVWATPKGTLYNPEDGKTYPYLFWEGYSDQQILLDSGFTLNRNDVAEELPTILKDLGLNQKESADFMEFWLPRLMDTKTPYIEFNFVGTELFNQVAPLTISPAPDKVIRIYMVYQGVYAPGLPVPDFVTPERYGFTVVEWGGDLR